MIQKNDSTCIMSIKPEFYLLIKKGIKKVEFRKTAPKCAKEIYLYVGSPIKKICGLITINKLVRGEVETIWDITKEISGIDYQKYLNYCKNKKEISALFIDHFFEIQPIDPNEIFTNFRPPQNYLYKDEKFSSMVQAKD